MFLIVLSIEDFDVYIPDTLKPILEMSEETGLSHEMLSIYHLIYGLRTVPVYLSGDIMTLITNSNEKLLNRVSNTKKIKYIIHVHTATQLIPYPDSLVQNIKNRYQLNHAIAFGMTMYKCVSFFKALEILNCLGSAYPNMQALVLTGEIAFTPKLRVVPRTTIVGDASTATLFSFSDKNHRLLSVTNRLLVGYSRGIYLTDAQLVDFDKQFMSEMVLTINEALFKCGLSLADIQLILPHNVNIPTWKKIALALHFPIEKIYMNNITRYGHCFCSDQIINLRSAIFDRRLQKGDVYLMAGCGMGFYFSAAVFRF